MSNSRRCSLPLRSQHKQARHTTTIYFHTNLHNAVQNEPGVPLKAAGACAGTGCRLCIRRCCGTGSSSSSCCAESAAASHVMYLSACSASMRAEYFASWNRESASSRSPLLMPSRPLVLDSMYEGVSSCNAQQQETAQPSKKRARLQAIFSGELACTHAQPRVCVFFSCAGVHIILYIDCAIAEWQVPPGGVVVPVPTSPAQNGAGWCVHQSRLGKPDSPHLCQCPQPATNNQGS